MFKYVIIFSILISLLVSNISFAHITYANKLCPNQIYSDLTCIKIKKIDTWNSLSNFYGITQIQLMNLNRTNKLIVNQWLIVPIKYNISYDEYLRYSGLPRIDVYHNTIDYSVVVDPNNLVWGLYKDYNLVAWGTAISGADKCIKKNGLANCHSPIGTFKILSKKGLYYRSTMYPINCKKKQCALMPYAMHIKYSGEAIHSSNDIPGYNASHGCIRVIFEDIKLLSKILSINSQITILSY